MEVEAGLDVAWCLTCSRRTRDARSTYCSEQCRLVDCGPTPSSSSSKLPFTSPAPAALFISPSLKSFDRRRSSASPTKAGAQRPPLPTRSTALPAASEASFSPPKQTIGARDRRAFSFPSAPNSPPLLFPITDRRGSTTLPAFARRNIINSLTPKSPPMESVLEDRKRMKNILAKRLSRSTGNNTPGTEPESVFLSTSESSEDEIEVPPIRPAVVTRPTPPLGPGPSALRSQLSLGRTNSLQSRSTSNSPVAAMVASSASSRSREDIISWAKAINQRDGAEDSQEDKSRGRTRTRRISSLARLPPPTTDLVEQEDEDADGTGSTGLATTPKGRIGSALAGLSGYGMGSIVKALTSVTTSPGRPAPARKTTPGRPGASQFDFVIAPSPAEVSRVAVVASTMPLDEGHTMQYGTGGTPTLSTVSFSEVVDPSVVGTDHVEIVTDDGGMSASSSGYARRPSKPQPKSSRKGSFAPIPPPLPDRQQKPQPPAVVDSAWNFTSIFSRFTPFGAISSVISPYTPFTGSAPHRPSNSSTQLSSASAVPTMSTTASCTPEFEAAAPMPAIRSRPDTPETPAQQLVRSVPLDIVAPPPPVPDATVDIVPNYSVLERGRQRESRSRARSRSRRQTSRDRDRSRSICSIAQNKQMGEMPPCVDLGKGVGMSNQDPDADADVSDDEDAGQARGRVWGVRTGTRVTPDEPEAGDRGRGRSKAGREGDERARGRGRDRSVKNVA